MHGTLIFLFFILLADLFAVPFIGTFRCRPLMLCALRQECHTEITEEITPVNYRFGFLSSWLGPAGVWEDGWQTRMSVSNHSSSCPMIQSQPPCGLDINKVIVALIKWLIVMCFSRLPLCQMKVLKVPSLFWWNFILVLPDYVKKLTFDSSRDVIRLKGHCRYWVCFP